MQDFLFDAFPSSHNFNAIKSAKFKTKRSHRCPTSSFTICSKSTQAEKSRSLLVRCRDDRFSHRSFSPSFNSLHSVLIPTLIDLFPKLSSHGRMQCKPEKVAHLFFFLSQIWPLFCRFSSPSQAAIQDLRKGEMDRERIVGDSSQSIQRENQGILCQSRLYTLRLLFNLAFVASHDCFVDLHPRNSLSLGFSKDLGYPSRDCQSERQTCHGETGASKWRLHRVRLLDVL